MNLARLTPQKVNLLKKNQPDLYDTLCKVFPEYKEDDAMMGRLAGLCIEYVIQSGGKVEIFGEDVDMLEEDEY